MVQKNVTCKPCFCSGEVEWRVRVSGRDRWFMLTRAKQILALPVKMNSMPGEKDFGTASCKKVTYHQLYSSTFKEKSFSISICPVQIRFDEFHMDNTQS